MMVCLKRKTFNGELICDLKRRLKRFCYYKWKTWCKLLSGSGLRNKLCAFSSSTTSHLLRVAQNISIGHQELCSSTLRTSEFKVYNWKFISLKFPWRKIRDCRQITFSWLTDWILSVNQTPNHLSPLPAPLCS